MIINYLSFNTSHKLQVKVPNLEKISIYKMDNLKMIWHNKIGVDSFCKLKSVEVWGCKKLVNVFPSNMCRRLLRLQSLHVENCFSLERVCDLHEMNSEEPDHILFMRLKHLEVVKCPNLKYIFATLNVAKGGVAAAAAEEVPVKFAFPNLTSMKLCHLRELKRFYPSRHSLEGPKLKTLEMRGCGIIVEGQMQQPLHYFFQQVCKSILFFVQS